MRKSVIRYLILLFIVQLVVQKNVVAQKNDPPSPLMLSGSWVPEDPRKIDFDKLPRIAGEHAIVHDVRPLDGHRVNQHNYLAFYDGQYWMMWSDGPGIARAPAGQHRDKVPGHDQSGQKVSYATSKDGLKWSEAKDITDAPKDAFGWIARGFWIYNGKLLALVTRFKGPGYAGDGLSLQAFELDGTKGWKRLGMVFDNAMNNFPPKQLPSGEWMMSRRDSSKNVHLLYGATKAYNQWTSVPAVSYKGTDFKAEEPGWWVLPDNKNLVSLYRDNGKSGFLYRSYSSDMGRTWSKPLRTNFPDATSKFSDTRLKDGRYVLVSNPNPSKRDPLTLAVSNDGEVFNKMIYIVGGRHIDYPHVLEHDGYLFIVFASAKQTVELIRVKVADIDKVQMPASPLVK